MKNFKFLVAALVLSAITPMGAVQIGVPIGATEVEFTVTNLLCGNNKHPKVTMPIERK